MDSAIETRENVQEKAYKEGKLDPTIAMGPTEHRTCRDPLCFLVFVLCWVASFIVAQYAFRNGDPNVLIPSAYSNFNTAPVGAIFYDDLKAAQPILIFVPIAAIILGFIFLCFLRNCAGCVLWSFIIIFLVGLVTFGFLCFDTLSNPDSTLDQFGILKSTSEATLKVLAFGSWTLAAIYILALFCLCNRIRLTAAILRCAAEFVREVPSALLAPLASVTIFGGYLIYWLSVSVYLSSIDEIKKNEQENSNHGLLKLFHLFHGFWNYHLIFGVTQFVIALMCCRWYFHNERKHELNNLLLKSYGTALFYQLGSIAFGSLILAALSTVKAVLAYFYRQLNSIEGNPVGRCMKYLYACILCFLDCFERMIQFLTRHSYTQMAMTGKSFCSSSKDAFYLVVRNTARFGLVHEFGKIFVGFGQFCITLVVTVLTYASVTKISQFQETVHFPLVPVALAAGVGYVIGTIFMTVYGMAADAIIQCYCIDEELNPNNRYAPVILRDFIEQHAGGHMLIKDAELSSNFK